MDVGLQPGRVDRRVSPKEKKKKEIIEVARMQIHVCSPLGLLLTPAVIVRVYVTAHTERITSPSLCVYVNHYSGPSMGIANI